MWTASTQGQVEEPLRSVRSRGDHHAEDDVDDDHAEDDDDDDNAKDDDDHDNYDDHAEDNDDQDHGMIIIMMIMMIMI